VELDTGTLLVAAASESLAVKVCIQQFQSVAMANFWGVDELLCVVYF
jgi:hypothetical protein